MNTGVFGKDILSSDGEGEGHFPFYSLLLSVFEAPRVRAVLSRGPWAQGHSCVGPNISWDGKLQKGLTRREETLINGAQRLSLLGDLGYILAIFLPPHLTSTSAQALPSRHIVEL